MNRAHTYAICSSMAVNNGVGGVLPNELSRLFNLRYLSLQEGVLTGTIPFVLGELQLLQLLDLDFNLLSGSIPESIYNLFNLNQLALNANALTGTLSSSIGQLTSLVFLQLDQNTLNGTIPQQLGQLTNLSKCPAKLQPIGGKVNLAPHNLELSGNQKVWSL